MKPRTVEGFDAAFHQKFYGNIRSSIIRRDMAKDGVGLLYALWQYFSVSKKQPRFILDLGAGERLWTRAARNLFMSAGITSVDASPFYDEMVRIRGWADGWVKADVREWAGPKRKADIIIVNDLAQYFTDDEVELLLAKIHHQWLQPKGLLWLNFVVFESGTAHHRDCDPQSVVRKARRCIWLMRRGGFTQVAPDVYIRNDSPWWVEPITWHSWWRGAYDRGTGLLRPV